jgi:hypothetical protein
MHNSYIYTKNIILILAFMLVIQSCGKKNTVNSDNAGSGSPAPTTTIPPGSAPLGAFAIPSNLINNVNQLKSEIQCQNGTSNARLGDLFFNVANVGVSGTSIVQGQLVPGGTAGNVSLAFAGLNYGSRDILFVFKTTDAGGNITGYNVLLSLCEFRNIFNPNEFFIGGNAQLSNFTITIPLNLDHDPKCGSILNIDKGEITFVSSNFGPIPRQFAKYCLQ